VACPIIKDAKKLGKLWQDESRSIPADQNNDPLGLIDDPYISGLAWIVEAGITPPLLQLDADQHYWADYNGIDTGICTSNQLSISLSEPFSIAVGITPSVTLQSGSASGDYIAFITKEGEDGTGYELSYDCDLGQIIFGIHGGGNYRDWRVTTNLIAGNNYRIIAVWDGDPNLAKTYINGILQEGVKVGASGNYILGTNSVNLSIGYWSASNQRYYNGFMTGAVVCSSALNPTEIVNLDLYLKKLI
jgi:hypothetical protein